MDVLKGYVLRNGIEKMYGYNGDELVVFLSLEKAKQTKEAREAELEKLDSTNYLIIEEVDIELVGKELNLARINRELGKRLNISVSKAPTPSEFRKVITDSVIDGLKSGLR